MLERGRESAGSGRDGRIKRGDRVRGIEVEKGEEWRRDGITLDSSWSFWEGDGGEVGGEGNGGDADGEGDGEEEGLGGGEGERFGDAADRGRSLAESDEV